MNGEYCCMWAVIIGVGLIIFWIVATILDHNKKVADERERAETARRGRIDSASRQVDSAFECICNLMKEYFSGNIYDTAIDRRISNNLDEMKNQNVLIAKDGGRTKDDMIRNAGVMINYFRQLVSKARNTKLKNMFDGNDYGNINKAYWEEAKRIDINTADQIIDYYSEIINNLNTDKFADIDTAFIPVCVWRYAMEKPFSAQKFQKAVSVFNSLFKGYFADNTIAEYYAMKQMGGDDVLNNRVRNLVKENRTTEELTTIASGLMWMKAYSEENMILQHLLGTGQQMSEKTQNRLHALSNGGGKAPTGFNVSSDGKELFFDVSALAWKDAEYTGFFENLAFQEKPLSYSLAVRDENKELFITQGLSMPNKAVIVDKLNAAFAEEYGDVVSAEYRKCTALSGSGEEKLEGILIEAEECRQMGMLVHIARIGKKLTIKFYTLFMPTTESVADQRQQALSLFKKLSPSVTMWESSIKDTVLMTIQQILNSEPDIDPIDKKTVNETGDVIF